MKIYKNNSDIHQYNISQQERNIELLFETHYNVVFMCCMFLYLQKKTHIYTKVLLIDRQLLCVSTISTRQTHLVIVYLNE